MSRATLCDTEDMSATVTAERYFCGHIDPSGHDRECECTACDECGDCAEPLFASGASILCGDCLPCERACGTCGEREGSEYAKRCCSDDNMIEV